MNKNNCMYPCVLGPGCELAKAYVKIQEYDEQYSPAMGLMRGTIFPELYRPYPPHHEE